MSPKGRRRVQFGTDVALYISEKAVTVMAEFRKSVLRTEFLTPGPDGGVRPGHFRKYAVLR